MKNHLPISYRWLMILSGMIILLSTCKKDSDPPSPKPGEVAIAKEVKVLTKQTWDQNFISLDSTNYTITFSGNLNSTQPIKVGDIIVSSEGKGLLRKVKTVNMVNGKIIVQTDLATLTEAISQGTLEFEQALTFSQVKSIDYNYPGIKLENDNSKGNNETVFKLDINTVLYDYDDNLGTTHDQVRIKGKFDCNWTIAGRINISFYDGLKEARFAFESNENLDLQLICGLQYKKEKPITLATINFTPITVMVGFVPVIFTPELKIILGIGGYANSSVTTGIKQNLSFNAGIRYLKDEGWGPFKEFNSGFDFQPPQLNMNAGAELYLKPELSLELYGFAGPYANLKLYGKLEADLLKTPWWTLYGGITMNAGAKVNIFDKFLLECTISDLLKKEIVVATATTLPIFQPILTTSSIASITQTTATGGGNITDQGGTPVLERGVCWSTSQNPSTSNNKTNDGPGIGSFTSSITGLTAGTTYYVRAYATNTSTTAYGNQISFTTSPNLYAPTVSTSSMTNIAQTTATGGGNITNDGGASVTARGVCWSTSQNPTTSNSKTTDATGTGIFTSNITGLTAGIKYYVRAYATNSNGTSYGSQVEFTTAQNINIPTLSTTAITSITQIAAVSGGYISSDGGSAVTTRGVCWSTSQSPTISNSKTTNGSGTGNFTSNITGLAPGTTYYVRSYATNSSGTAYGDQVSFSTLPVNLPTLTTNLITSITRTTSTGGGNVTSEGGGSVTARGVCWSTSQNPTISDTKTTNGTGTGSFTSYITGLTPGITYYVRAYATNSTGTTYGNQVNFTTPLNISLPTLSTNSITSIAQTTATGGGNITSDGGASVTSRGVCWSTAQNPTTSNSKTSNGSGTGSFISYITGLTAGTTYYVRAYAINSVGTAYGSQVSFTSLSGGQPETITDIDGNVYNIVTIGTQIWMKENLKTTRYSNGSNIPKVVDYAEWENLSTPAYCWYNNDEVTYKDVYGALYNWFAVNSANLCPIGWHVSRIDEWDILANYLGGIGDFYTGAGGKLKEADFSHWRSPNTGATNESGFTGLPGGARNAFTNTDQEIGINGSWWTTYGYLPGYAYGRILHYNNTEVPYLGNSKQNGLSVRCVKD